MRSRKSSRRRHHRRAAAPEALVPLAGDDAAFDDATALAMADVLFGSPSSLDHGESGHDSKLEQLCAQVADALTLALASAHNAVLRELEVVAVTPRRGAACLEVRLVAGPDRDPRDAAAAVHRGLGWLRTEVADAIARKRVPELVAVVLPPGATPEETEP